MMNPPKSWVSRWQQSDNFVKGMYAVKVPDGDLDRVEQREDDEDNGDHQSDSNYVDNDEDTDS